MINRPLACKTTASFLRALVLSSALCSLLAVCRLSPVAASEPQLELTCEGDTLTISASDVPRASVLREIARQRGLSVKGIENAGGLFTGWMRAVSLTDLLRELLAGGSYTLIEGPDEDSLTIGLTAAEAAEDTLPLLRRSDSLPTDQKKALLLMAARDRDPFVRELAYRKLYEEDEKVLAEILTKDSRDPDPDVRRVSVSALGEIFGSPSVGILKEATEDPNPDVRLAAFHGLSLLQREGVETIRSRLSHSDPEIRCLAIETMASLGEMEAKEAALAAIRDDDEMVRGRAEGLLAEIAAAEGE